MLRSYVMLLYYPDVIAELCFPFSQPDDVSPETPVSSSSLNDKKRSEDGEKDADTEIENTRNELHDHEADRTECEARLHTRVRSPLT